MRRGAAGTGPIAEGNVFEALGGTQRMASVLLIESEAPLVRLMAWFLLEAGFEVSKVPDGDQALTQVDSAHPNVVVFNTTIPSREKAECIEGMRKVSPDSRILDVTDGGGNGRGEPDTGADKYLHLPFHADTFIEAVAELAGNPE
jgi:DNA-binding response OmpR family regulator